MSHGIPLHRPIKQGGTVSASDLSQRLDDVERLANFSCEWPLVREWTAAGPHLKWGDIPPIPARIMGGTNPYDWREVIAETDGVWGMSPTPLEGGSSGPTSAAYERNGLKTVPPGTLVLLYHAFPNQDAEGQEWVFDYAESPVPAKITGTTGAPTTTLNGGIDASVTSLTATAATDFPGRNDFYIKIDDEVMKVTAGAGTTGWTVTRGVDSTDAAAHTDTTTITLAAAYSWTEQKEDDNGNWEDQDSPRSGTAVSQPAYERNVYSAVESGTYVLLWRRFEEKDGSSSLSDALDNSSTTIPITARDSFPQTGDFCIQVDAEIMLVTAGNGTGAGNFTATRGFYGTRAEAHDSGDGVVEVIADWVFDLSAGAAGSRTNLTVQTGAVTYADATTTPISNVNKIEYDSAFFALRKPSARLAEVDWLGFKLRKNSTGSVGQRRRLNVIEGANIEITYSDDSGNDEHDVTFAVDNTDNAYGDADHGAKAVDADAQTVTNGTSAALTFNDTDEYDNTGYHDTGSNTSRMTFAFGANGRYIVCYATSADVTFSGSDVTPETISTYAQLNGSGEVTGSRDCGTIWRISTTSGTTTIANENDHLCLGRTFMVNITDYTTQYLEIIADASGSSLDVDFDDRSFSVHLLNRSGAV